VTAIHVRMIQGGKIVIPAALRRKYKLEVGKTVVVEDGEHGIMIQSLDDAIVRAQAIMARYAKGVSLADELVAERHAEAANE